MKIILKYLIILINILFFFLCINSYSATLATERIGYVDIDKVYSECPEVKLKEDERKAEVEKRNKIIRNKKEELERQKTEYEILKSSYDAENKRYEEEKKKYDEFVEAMNKPAIRGITSSTNTSLVNISSETVPVENTFDSNMSSETVITENSPGNNISSATIPGTQLEPNLPKSPDISEADLKKIEENIKSMENDIASQEANFQDNIKNYDNSVLYNIYGKIYEAIKDVAMENGYTIILDKRAVFFYLKESDVTDLVIKKLK